MTKSALTPKSSAIYYGSVGIKKIRHTLLACLIADAAGLTAALILGCLFFHNAK